MSALPMLHPNIPVGRFDLAELLDFEPPTRWRPDPGDRVQGRFVQIKEQVSFGRLAPTMFVLVPPETGDIHDDLYITVRASGVVLRGHLDTLKPLADEEVAMKYEGMRPTADGQREYAYYQMAVRRGGRWVVAK